MYCPSEKLYSGDLFHFPKDSEAILDDIETYLETINLTKSLEETMKEKINDMFKRNMKGC